MAERTLARRHARASRAAFVAGLAAPVRLGLEQALAQHLLPHLPSGPLMLASYFAVGDEIDPAPAHGAVTGATLLFPRVVARDAPLSFHAAATEAFVPGPLGIAEPLATAPTYAPDVLLVPLLSVDADGNRLGQGGGHYDRTLALLRRRGAILAIGVAWDVQRVERLPTEPWDQPLDALVTPSAFLWFGRNAMSRPWN